MKKINLLFAIILASLLMGVSYSYSQSILLLESDTEIQSSPDMTMKSFATIKNFSSVSLEIGLKIIKLSVLEGHQVGHCFGGNCFPPTTNDTAISPGTLTLEPGEESTDDDYDVQLEPNGIEGESTLKIVFFVIGNESDFVEYEVKFIAGEVITPDVEIIEANTFVAGDDINVSYKSYATLKNNTDHSVDIGLKIIKISVFEGHDVLHCFGANCYPPVSKDTTISPGTLTLEPGEESTEADFDIELNPNGIQGTSIIKLVFFVIGDEENNDDYQVEFKIGSSGVTDNSDNLNCLAFPNPANNFVNVDLSDLSGNVQIKVYNSQSNLMSDYSLSNPDSSYLLNCSDFSQGVYNLIILKNGKEAKQGRFVIVR
ncbi:MAG TPA: T9SS type A sorting domain-containing protein [Candidatus Kapabacteria bacterium]|nr:T9SS type A sorting domain-containing protein [Candidatus Kapabacteria bacterium]HPO62164.1 T9SS type A sorting domain-containing protein [Candidatus Kapabacteria bacterium]